MCGKMFTKLKIKRKRTKLSDLALDTAWEGQYPSKRANVTTNNHPLVRINLNINIYCMFKRPNKKNV